MEIEQTPVVSDPPLSPTLAPSPPWHFFLKLSHLAYTSLLSQSQEPWDPETYNKIMADRKLSDCPEIRHTGSRS